MLYTFIIQSKSEISSQKNDEKWPKTITLPGMVTGTGRNWKVPIKTLIIMLNRAFIKHDYDYRPRLNHNMQYQVDLKLQPRKNGWYPF